MRQKEEGGLPYVPLCFCALCAVCCVLCAVYFNNSFYLLVFLSLPLPSSLITMTNAIGRLVANLCTVVPEGVVCFLPSYDYEVRGC